VSPSDVFVLVFLALSGLLCLLAAVGVQVARPALFPLAGFFAALAALLLAWP